MRKSVLYAGITAALALFCSSPMLAEDKKADAGCCNGDKCSQCRDTCLKALNYCLTKGGKYVAEKHITTLMDCIDTCDMNSRMAARKSPTHALVSKVCSQVCEKCAKSCDDLKDPALADCVKTCQDCSKYCSGEAGHK